MLEINEEIKYFRIAKFKFTAQTKDTLYLPSYKGSTLRGGFGQVLKRVVCITKDKECRSCLFKERCVYSYIFETPPPDNTAKLKKYPFAPHPFVIEPPLEKKREYKEKEEFAFHLILIGKAIDYLPYFVFVFDKLGELGIGRAKGRYWLKEVRSIENSLNSNHLIYTGKDKLFKDTYSFTGKDDIFRDCKKYLTKDKITLNFLTPTRLKFKEHYIKDLEFHILVRNLLRRISLLSYFHCNRELKVDFKDLIEKSKMVKKENSNLSWYDWQRYSTRQETRMKLGGFVGKITFDFSEISPEYFLPLILWGTYIHVGKGTSFGLGKYEVVD